MSDEKYFVGVDWGGSERAVGCLVKVEGETVGVLQTFELGDREVRQLKELGAPRDFIIPAKSSGSIPLSSVWVNEEWLKKMAGEDEKPPPLNRAQRRKQRKEK